MKKILLLSGFLGINSAAKMGMFSKGKSIVSDSFGAAKRNPLRTSVVAAGVGGLAMAGYNQNSLNNLRSTNAQNETAATNSYNSCITNLNDAITVRDKAADYLSSILATLQDLNQKYSQESAQAGQGSELSSAQINQLIEGINNIQDLMSKIPDLIQKMALQNSFILKNLQQIAGSFRS